jgi:tyrosyl-tRNA synthetase
LNPTFSAAARQLALGNGLYLNNVPQPDVQFKLERSHLVDGRVAILRAGKDKHLILALR